MSESKEKKSQNTDEEYNEALANDNPTNISNNDLEYLAKEAIKKFKSLG